MVDIVVTDEDKIDIKIVSNENQIKAIEDLAYEIWHEHYMPIIGKSQVEYMLEKFQSVKAITKQIQNGFLYFLAEHDNEFLGYMSMEISGREVFLSKFYVVLDKRGKGYGREMISFIEDLARRKSLNKISLTVNINNTDSIKMYEKVGFINCGAVVKNIGNGFIMDDYKMEKRL